MRVLKGRPLNLTHTFLDGEDALVQTAVTVTLRNWRGVTVATVPAVKDVDSDEWAVTFPAQSLGVYTVEWAGDTATDETTTEVVGAFMFTVPQARNSDDYLSDANAFPATEIEHYREVVAAEFEQITGRSFVPRVTYKEYYGDGSRELVSLIPDAQAVEEVWVNGVAVDDVSEYRVTRLGKIITPTETTEEDRIEVAVRYGFNDTPSQVRRVGMVRLRNLIAAETSGIPDRATTWQPEEGGTFRLATPGQGKWRTGIPEVDSTLSDFTLDTVMAVYGFA